MPENVYLILAVTLFALVALVAIIIRRGGVRMKAPGVEFEVDPEQAPVPEEKGPSAKTAISGGVSGGTVTTSAKGGQAETSVGESVEGTDILTEA